MSNATKPLEDVLDHIEKTFEGSVERLADFLRIPSVSTDPAHDADTHRCAEFASDMLADIGFKSRVVKTDGHPMVVAHRDGPEADSPRVLYYGHYDVQPPDPIELWDHEAFDPVVVDGEQGKRIVARGAVDDKGQVMTIVEALRAWHEVQGGTPCAVTVMLEGEEESGSPSLDPFLESHRDELAADVCIVSDTGMWDIETPAITTMLRGMVYVEVTLHGPSSDLHSGMYGGAVINPINELARLVAGIHDADGRVQFEGFYDGVNEVDPKVMKQWDELGFDDAAFLGMIGLKHGHGESGRSTLERTWSRPTCDANGIIGGYTGEGAKTVIASHARAKLSCRLVAGQDPERVRESIETYFRTNARPDCRIEIENHGCNPAISVPTDSHWLTTAASALEEVFGREARLIGTGGSIPAVGSIQELLGINSLLIGFGLDDDNVHAPNEKFELTCLKNGIRSHAAILAAFAEARG
ncbi:MAG: dipeptidase [Phycisphaerales bacterium]|jgi:acetylornithine deacetylase/succinyl-diaminopimelate desuccinylase-like protein|nr:dipeptidase [Phycisphaerales bacterium]